MSKTTISGYSKTKVVSMLTDRLRLRDVQGGSQCTAELNASNHTELVVSKLVCFAAKEVNACLPRWPSHFLRLITCSGLLTDQAGRNSQEVRNSLAEMTTILAMANKKAIKPPRLGEKDFETSYLQSKTIARTRIAQHVVQNNDPREFVLPINELGAHIIEAHKSGLLDNRQDHVTGVMYWATWFLDWDKNMSSTKVDGSSFRCAARKSKWYDHKFATEPVWLLWDLLLGLANSLHSSTPSFVDNIYAIYRLYCFNFTKSRKTERRWLIYNALQYFTQNTNWLQQVTPSRLKVLYTVATINFTYARIASGAKLWEESVRPSMISDMAAAEAQKREGLENSRPSSSSDAFSEAMLRQEVQAIVETPLLTLGRDSVAGANARSLRLDVEDAFEARRRSYDPPLKFPRALPRPVPTLSIKPALEPRTVSHRQLPVVCIGGAGCVFSKETSRQRLKDGADPEQAPPQVKTIVIGLDSPPAEEQSGSPGA